MNHDFSMGKVQSAQMILLHDSVVYPAHIRHMADEVYYKLNAILNAIAEDRDKPKPNPRKGRKKPTPPAERE